MREIIATGASVEEATENACQELGLARWEVSVEILEMPSKKLFKNIPAKVKVTADAAEEPVEEKKAAPEAPRPAPAPRAEKPAHKPAESRAAKTTILEDPEEERIAIDLAQNAPARQAVEYITDIFAALGVSDLSVTAFSQGDATLFCVDGEEVSRVMDIRGDTIQSFSYLIDRAVNKSAEKREGAYLRVRLDIAGYRDRRETELLALAQRVGGEVQRTHRSRTLPPMNSYERLIIHTAISKMEGLASESVGADMDRRVVVKSTAPDATEGGEWRMDRPDRRGGSKGGGRDNRDRDRNRPPRDGGKGGRGDKRGGGGGGRSYTPEREYADRQEITGQPIVPERREAISDADELPLFGKIEL